jgi:hypothetical protein
MLGRLARGLGAAALTGNWNAGMVAAGTNNFALGTMFGIADNLVNPQGINYGMTYHYPNAYNNSPWMMPNNTMPTNCFPVEPMPPFGGFQRTTCFGYDPTGYQMWTNPAILW